MQAVITDTDPFDLPEWLGTHDVVWRPTPVCAPDTWCADTWPAEPDAGLTIACDLLAVDEAYPAPVVDDDTRLRVHQAWRHGQVVVGEVDSRLVLAVPGTRFGPELVLDALGRLARAVGARTERYAALLRLG